jgi:fimbrial chaperone protein
MRPRLHFGCIISLLLLVAESTHAGSFSVSPTRIELSPGQRTAVITVRNADTSPLTVQTQLVAWTQETGEETYTDTRDILATPPVFTIPPNGEQVVRVALRKEPDATLETAYRVFLQEIPGARTTEGNSLNIALRVGVPLFVSPVQKAVGKLEWLARPQPDGKLHVEAMNNGTAHVQVTGFEVSLEGHAERIYVNQMKYVLPGTHASWIVDLPDGVASGPAAARVVGSSDRGNFEAPAALAPRL